MGGRLNLEKMFLNGLNNATTLYDTKKYGDKKYKEKKKREDPQYKNQLEREVIEDYEWEIARKHGDIREDEVTREGHYGSLRFFSTKGYGYAAAEYFREEITESIEIIK